MVAAVGQYNYAHLRRDQRMHRAHPADGQVYGRQIGWNRLLLTTLQIGNDSTRRRLLGGPVSGSLLAYRYYT